MYEQLLHSTTTVGEEGAVCTALLEKNCKDVKSRQALIGPENFTLNQHKSEAHNPIRLISNTCRSLHKRYWFYNGAERGRGRGRGRGREEFEINDQVISTFSPAKKWQLDQEERI